MKLNGYEVKNVPTNAQTFITATYNGDNTFAYCADYADVHEAVKSTIYTTERTYLFIKEER